MTFTDDYLWIYTVRRAILITAVLATTVSAGLYIGHKSRKESTELRHLALPTMFQPYDTNPRDGILQRSELEAFARDHPDAQEKK